MAVLIVDSGRKEPGVQSNEYADYLTSLRDLGDSIEVTAVRLANRGPTATTLWIEPWGDMITLAPESQCHIIAHGSPGAVDRIVGGDVLTIDWRGEAITVWASSYAQDLRIFQDGSLVWEP